MMIKFSKAMIPKNESVCCNHQFSDSKRARLKCLETTYKKDRAMINRMFSHNTRM